MRLHLVWIAGWLGCGSVATTTRNDAATTDAATTDAAIVDGAISDAGTDGASVCTIHDTIDSCGQACAQCPPARDRTTPTCDGTSCGVACIAGAPKCSDDSCSRLTWTFESNMADGVTLIQPAGLAAGVRNHAGNLAFAVTVPQLQTSEVRVSVPVCISGTTQLQTKTLHATIFLDEPTPQTGQFYIQAALPTPMTGAFLSSQTLDSGVYFAYNAPLSMSQFANTANQIVFQIGTYGAAFTGTIWIDDIQIQ